jgi:hypothetical protein
MGACLNASDFNDAEWALLEPLVLSSQPAGAADLPIAADHRCDLLNGCCYRTRIHRAEPSFTTVLSGARLAPGST